MAGTAVKAQLSCKARKPAHRCSALRTDLPFKLTMAQLEPTRQRLHDLRLSWQELPLRRDIDHAEDASAFPHLVEIIRRASDTPDGTATNACDNIARAPGKPMDSQRN